MGNIYSDSINWIFNLLVNNEIIGSNQIVKNIIFNDITLRDGEQAAGVNFYPVEKLQIATQLVKMGLPMIEVGFPVASESDFEGAKLIARNLGKIEDAPIICAMAIATKESIDKAWQAVLFAKHPRIQVVLATSDIHLEYKLKKSRQEALELACEMIRYAKSKCEDVEFAAEDATRSDPKYLIDILEACIEAGATTLEIPDTVGYCIPEEYGLIVRMVSELIGKRKVFISVHCHNDLGMATANTLAGIINGAKQVECTINGIGERVGNAPFEEVVMALKTRQSYYDVDVSRINTKEIVNTSKLVSQLSGIPIGATKAIVGKNAFTTGSGIHQHGMICNAQTYQIMNPEDVGASSYMVLSKLSGKHALKQRLVELGYDVDGNFDTLYQEFKQLASKKKFILDEDVIGLMKGK